MMRPAAFRTAGDTHNCDCWIRHPSIPIGSCCFFLFGNVWNQGQLSTKQHSILYTWLAMIFWHWPSPKRIRLSIKIKTSDLSRTDFSKILFDWTCLMVEKCALGEMFYILLRRRGLKSSSALYKAAILISIGGAIKFFFPPFFVFFQLWKKPNRKWPSGARAHFDFIVRTTAEFTSSSRCTGTYRKDWLII